MPFKKLGVKFIALMNAFKNKDFKAFYMLKYIFAKKNTP